MIEKIKHHWVSLSATLIIIGFSLLRASHIPELDVLWGARNGSDILNGGVITHPVDTWNFQTLGETWSPNSWLWNVLLSLFITPMQGFGLWLLVLLSNFLILGLTWFFLRETKVPHNYHPVLLLVMSVMFLYFTNGRSNTADAIVFLLFTVVVSKNRYKDFATQFVTYVTGSLALSALWINLHFTGVLAVILFPAIVWALTSDSLTTRQRVGLSASVGFTALVGTLISPFGTYVYEKLFIVQDESVDIITEWGPIIQPGEFLWLHMIIIALAVTIAMYFLITKKPALYALLLLAFSVQTVFTSRYGLPLALLVIASFGVIKWKQLNITQTKYMKLGSLMLGSTVTMVGVGLTIGVLAGVVKFYPVPLSEFSVIPQNSKVLATQHVGSALLFYRPDVQVAIDGRNDLIGKERMAKAYSVFYEEDSNEALEWLNQYSVNVVFIDSVHYENSTEIINHLREAGWEEKVNENSIQFTK